MANQTVPRDFSDDRVFVVGASDPLTHRLHGPSYLGFEQTCDGPRYIVVGPDVSDEKLIRNLPHLSDRYGVSLAQLQAARQTQGKTVKTGTFISNSTEGGINHG